MLNPFPIQFLALFAYFLLRICVGCILIYFGFTHMRSRSISANTHASRFSLWVLILGELLIGGMFILGLYTQFAALATMALALISIIFRRIVPLVNHESKTFYVLLFFSALSLFITGAGVFAFDLPI